MTVVALHASAVFDAGPKDIGLMFSAIAATQVTLVDTIYSYRSEAAILDLTGILHLGSVHCHDTRDTVPLGIHFSAVCLP
eukprot:COSAG05_NODE_107_length_18696_cov_209.227766_18_plen_80_part_00